VKFAIISLFSFLTGGVIIHAVINTSPRFADPKTHIVLAAEAGGCPGAQGSSYESVARCMNAHEALAKALAPECRWQSQHIDGSHWGDSTEGQVCKAAIATSAFAAMRFVADN
jgi:hypothetical protein